MQVTFEIEYNAINYDEDKLAIDYQLFVTGSVIRDLDTWGNIERQVDAVSFKVVAPAFKEIERPLQLLFDHQYCHDKQFQAYIDDQILTREFSLNDELAVDYEIGRREVA